MFWAGVTRIVFAATTEDIIDALQVPRLSARCADVLATGSTRVQVDGPLLRADAVAVLKTFVTGS
jgi:tRNA(adenine34) deaminase